MHALFTKSLTNLVLVIQNIMWLHNISIASYPLVCLHDYRNECCLYNKTLTFTTTREDLAS